MVRFLVRRLLLMIPMVLVALTIAFVMVQMAPGSPFSSQRRLPPEIEANLKAKYGFDQPKLTHMLASANCILNPAERLRDIARVETYLLRRMPLLRVYYESWL